MLSLKRVCGQQLGVSQRLQGRYLCSLQLSSSKVSAVCRSSTKASLQSAVRDSHEAANDGGAEETSTSYCVLDASSTASNDDSHSNSLLWWKTMPTWSSSSPHSSVSSSLLLSAALVVGLAILAEPSLAHAATPRFDLAEDTPFWANVVRYGRFFVTVMLGTGSIMLRPFAGMFKSPLSAVLGVGGLVGSAFLLKFTLDAMLGMSEPFTYAPDAINAGRQF